LARPTMSASAKSWWATIKGGFAVASALLLAVTVAGLTVSALIASPAEAAPRSLKDPEVVGEINRIQGYLNRITSLESRFIQVNPDGSSWSGKVYVQRPGKFRFEYDPPVPHLLVANGLWFIHVDKQLKETNVLPLIKTPAHFLVRNDISFKKGLTVTKYDKAPGVMQVSVITDDNPELGEMTLTFTDKPLELRKWSIRDVQDNTTQVTLQNMRFGMKLDPKLFKFVEQGDSIKAE